MANEKPVDLSHKLRNRSSDIKNPNSLVFALGKEETEPVSLRSRLHNSSEGSMATGRSVSQKACRVHRSSSLHVHKPTSEVNNQPATSQHRTPTQKTRHARQDVTGPVEFSHGHIKQRLACAYKLHQKLITKNNSGCGERMRVRSQMTNPITFSNKKHLFRITIIKKSTKFKKTMLGAGKWLSC